MSIKKHRVRQSLVQRRRVRLHDELTTNAGKLTRTHIYPQTYLTQMKI